MIGVTIMKNKKVIMILSFLILLLLSITFIWVGTYFNRLSSPKNIMGKVIDSISNRLQNDFHDYTSHYLGDNYTMNSNIQFQLESEKLLKNKDQDVKALEQYRFLQNLSHLQSNLIVMKDQKNEKYFASLQQKLGEEEVVNAKYVIDNSTEYYFVNHVLKNYVNNGNSSYFETLNSETTSLDNIDYLYSFILQSLKNQLKEEYFHVSMESEKISGEEHSVREVSFQITDKVIHNILKGILEDLQKDETSLKILTGIDEDFSKRKISSKTVFLEKDESYTIHIYTSTILCRPLKYEIVYLNGDEEKSIVYEGDEMQGEFYYIENDQVQKRMVIHFEEQHVETILYNAKDDKIGTFQYNKDNTGISFDFDYDDTKEKYHFVYYSKYENVKENSFDNHQKLTIKVVRDKVGILDGTISVHTNFNKKVKIVEDVSNSVLASTLNDEQKKGFEQIREHVLERLKK